jgi:hypothetical protein
MLGVEHTTSPRTGGMAASRPDLAPHPPAVLPIDTLAPRPKQPHMYSRARALPGKTAELSSRTIEAASVASLSASVQSIEGRVASVRAMRATSPLTRVLQAQHPPASTQRQKRSKKPAGKLPPMGRGKEDEESSAELVASVGTVESAETVGESALRLGVFQGSGLSIPDMHGLQKQESGESTKRNYPDSALASSWLEEVVSYGLAEIGDPNKGLAQEFENMHLNKDTSGVAQLGVSYEQLRKAGLAEKDIDRLYRAMYVYSVGFHEMVQEVVGTGQKSARSVVNVLRTFNFVSEVIQRTSFTNNLVSVMLENESNTARIAALQAEIAQVTADQDDKGMDLEVQEKMYDDAVADLLRHRQEKEAMEAQLASVQALMDALSLPGGEIYRLKLLLEEAQTSKHEVVTQARQQIGDLEAMLRNEKNQHKRLQESFRQYRDETESDAARKENEWAAQKKERDDKIRWLGNEMDKLRIELDARNKQIPELEEAIATETKNARVQQLALKGVIEDLRKEVKDVKKQAIEDTRIAIEEQKVAVVKKDEAIIRGDTLDVELKTTKAALEETKAYTNKLQDDVADLGNSLSAVKTKLNESQSKLSLEMATTVDLRKQIEDLRKEMAERSAKLEQEVQDWKDKEAKTKEAGEKKYEREKEKGAKVVASKDEQLGKLRDTVKNGKMQIQELRDQKAQMKKSWEADVKKFEKLVAKLEKTIENRDATIEKLKEDKAGLESTIKKLKKDIEKLKSKAKKDLATQKEEYEAIVTDMSMQINKLTKKCENFEKDKASLKAALEREVAEFKKAREMVVNHLKSFDKQLKAKERQLEEQSQLKINLQQGQIKKLSTAVAGLEHYRQNLVRQRETLRQNLVRNANELQLAKDETDTVRAEVEELKMQIKKLEMYLRRYRERFQSSDVGCQAGLEVVMEDKIDQIHDLTQQLKDGDSDDADGANKPLEMMELAMQLVEILEESANLPKGSVSRFFRIAIDEYDIHEDQVKQQVATTKVRYATVQKENAAISDKCQTIKKDLLSTETNYHELEIEKAQLKADIERGPPELATLAQAADDAKEDALKWQKLYEAAAASIAAVAQSSAVRIRDRDLQGAQDYHKLLQQCDANTPITQEMLSDIEEEVSANAELTANELISTAEDIIQQGQESGINVDVAAKAMEEMDTLRDTVTTLADEKNELARRMRELSDEKAAFEEAVAAASHDSSGAGVTAAVRTGGVYAGEAIVAPHPVGVYASWHRREPRAAQTWNDVTLLLDQVPDPHAMSVDNVQAVIFGIYMEKVHAELVQGKETANMCDFAVRIFEERYGLADLAEQQLLSFIAGIRKHHQATMRIKLFNQFCRLDPKDKNVTAINRGSQAQEYFLNVLHSLHGFLGRDQTEGAKGPFQTTDKLRSTTGSLGSTAASEDFGWATRWLASSEATLSGNNHVSERPSTVDSGVGRRVMVPLEIVRTVGASVFAAEAASIMPKLLQYIEAAQAESAGDGGADMGATAALSVPSTPGGGGSKSADLDVVLMAFMRVWEEGIVRRLSSMQGLFVTAKGRSIQQSIPFSRETGEVKTMLTAHSWNPAVAALSTAVQATSDAVETTGDAASYDTARQLTKTLQSTNLLLSKTIQLLAREQEGSAAWSAYQLLMEGLQNVAANAVPGASLV